MFNRLIKFLLIYSFLIDRPVRSDENSFSCKETEDKDYDKWIGNMIEEEKYFQANIEVVDLQSTVSTVSLIDEVYDFKNKYGELKFQHRFSNQESMIEYAKYFDDSVYLTTNNTSKCEKKSLTDNEVLRRFIFNWLPNDLYTDGKASYDQILGPSSMLLHLNDKIKSTHKYSFKDEDEIQNFGYNFCVKDKYMIKYFMIFEGTLNKNFIKTIQILQRKDDDKKSKNAAKKPKGADDKKPDPDDDASKWTLRTQFNYYFVDVRTDLRLNNNLPIGVGCSREATDFKSPQMNNKQFELDFQFVRNRASYMGSETINHFDPHYSIIENNKLYLDYVDYLAVNFKEDPTSNLTKQVHDYSIRMLYDIDLSTGTCNKIVEEQGDGFVSIDFDDSLSIVKNIGQVLKLNETSNNYIGKFYTRNIECEVYETKFDLQVNGNKESFIVTHYYTSYDFKPDSPDKLPIRIDLKEFIDPEFSKQLGYYVFMINKFYSGFDFVKQEIFDISYCMPYYYQYNWFLIEFTCAPEQIKQLKSAQYALMDAFRKRLGISALRLPKILIDFDDSTIYFTTKLLEVPAVDEHFEIERKKKLSKPQVNYLADHEENCAKSCFGKPDCVAFSYCSDMQCAQLMLENYSDDKVNIPEHYVKSEDNDICNLRRRKFKLKRDDISSRDIRSVMSTLNQNVNSGKFSFDVKISSEDAEDQKINLKASEIVLNVEPGSKQSNYQDGEQELRHDTSQNYEQFFSVYLPEYSYDYKKLKEKKIEFVGRHSNVALADCELRCMNNLNCHSFSYCPNQICVITSAFDTKTIDDNSNYGAGCFVSKRNYLSDYAIHEHRGIRNMAKKTTVLTKLEEETPETCAKLCSSSNVTDKYDCLSFEYCDAKKKDSDESEKVCLFHELNLQSEHDQKLEWDFGRTNCDHYAKKHSTAYKEYSMQKLVNYDLGERTKLSLEKCATICDEHELCNTFDYCFEGENGELDNQNIRCHLHTDVYASKNVKPNSATCSVYSSIKPKIPVKEIKSRRTTYSKGLTVLLSFVALISGSSVGVLLSFLVIRKFFRDEEDD